MIRINSTFLLLVFLLLTPFTSPTWAQDFPESATYKKYKIDEINLAQGFDRSKGKFFKYPENLPNPYGVNIDLLVVVVLSIKDEDTLSNFSWIDLDVYAPQYFTPATGLQEAWKLNFRERIGNSLFVNDEKTHIPFFIPYRCTPDKNISIKATISYPEQEYKLPDFSLPCAE